MSTSPEALDVEARIARLEQHDQRLTQLLELLAQRHAAPAKTGRDWDAYAAVIASFIGLLALAVAGYTAHVQRQQLRAQVWPRLQLTYSNVHFRLWADNAGTGPARITAMRVAVDGTPVQTWDDVEKAIGANDKGRLIRSSFSRAVLPAGKEHTLIVADDDDNSRRRFRQLLPRGKHAITIVVCYCSVLDDCWTAAFGYPFLNNSGGSSECPIADSERFYD
jgi:hypothetical protein